MFGVNGEELWPGRAMEVGGFGFMKAFLMALCRNVVQPPVFPSRLRAMFLLAGCSRTTQKEAPRPHSKGNRGAGFLGRSTGLPACGRGYSFSTPLFQYF